MKIRTLYSCELCHTDYADEKKAVECEKSHKKIKKVLTDKSKYHSMGDYPDTVRVIFADGSEMLYKR